MSAQPMQRVIQVCFGCEHGVLVTDAGIPFTFGDNRYGQLGRSACKLSENNKPFPVLDLMEHEIVQVAAGTHHCMALTASRFVWAWGRNKVGQLGCGDTHDHITPTMVTLSTGGPQLGNIVTISAGGNSSVAASLSSEVWQWGEVSRDFTHVPRDSKDPGPPPTEKQKAVPVEKKLPFCIFRREDFQRKMRKQPTSVSELGLRVLHGLKPFEKDHVRDLFKSARKWRRSIADARVELKRETSEAQNSKSSSRGDADHSMADLNDVNDAVGTMQRELKMIDREIRLLEQNLEACELQQKHLRDEIMGLAGQGVRLSAKENQISMNLYEKGGERNLEKEMAEIKALLEANHNTRTTLLEQRTQTDKEKQHVDDQLKERRRLRDEQQKRMWRRQLAAVGAGGDGAKLELDDVATDLTQMAMDGLLDPVIGREAELQRVIQVLLRRRKNNACLVGPPGVGKTAVAEGLAQRIAEGTVPSKLRGKRVYSLDLGAIVAGTKYRGEFEERLKNVIAEATDAEKGICLFIDEIHQLVGAGVAGADSSMDAANLLKPALARGELQVIGATTADEYVRHVEKDAALERRFQKVVCEEPSVADTAKILEGLRAAYEAHHGVLVAPEALGAAARLSQRYLPERFLPDKAIDLLDEAGSVAQLRQEAAALEAMDSASVVDEKKPLVTASDIAAVLSKWSGVPVERLTEDEARRLLRLEEQIAERIIGQREAVSALGRAVRRARAGLAGSRRPIASLYFAGPTGVGKTELCRVLAAEYYSDPKALIRLDMSEYSEQHSVSRLVGPPPGYVGFDDPRSGQLTEAVRRRPYSVVVLDEIEKAHPEVLNLLLQVLEDGRLTDGKGRTVSFADCIVIMTSNVGSREILEQANAGGGYSEMRAAVQTQLQRRFRPEFINRIDEILVFRSLSPTELRAIARLGLRDAAGRAEDAQGEEAMRQGGASQSKSLHLDWTAKLEDAVLEHGSDTTYGARPLRRAVQRLFEDPLAELLVGGTLVDGGEASVDLEGDTVVVRYDGKTLRPSLAAALLEDPASASKAGQQPLGPVGGTTAPAAVAVS